MRSKWFKYLQIGFTILVLLVSRMGIVSISAETRFFFIDVGQGDALLVLTPENISVLIDTGPDISVLSGLGKYLPGRHIDYLILSHPDLDHVGGLTDLLRSYTVGTFIGEAVGAAAILKPDTGIANGDGLALGCCLYLRLYNLNSTSEDSNERSVAVLMHAGAISLFSAGDLPSKLEDQLAPELGQVDILKVGHHGSSTSSDAYFLDTIKPKFAVISVGRNNKYGHPKADTLARLTAAGARILRTDEQGDIDLATDGKELRQIPSRGFLW